MKKSTYKIFLVFLSLCFLSLLNSCCKVEHVAGEGTAGDLDGLKDVARFNKPAGLLTDPWKNIYVADYYNHKIRQVVQGMNNVTTFAGTGTAGCNDGKAIGEAQFRYPVDIARDADGNFFVADRNNHAIRRIDGGTGVVTTYAGQCGIPHPKPDACDGYVAVPSSIHADSAHFRFPSGVAVDEQGNVYVADYGTCSVRKIDAKTKMVTLVGNSATAAVTCCSCTGLFSHPAGIDLDADGNIFVSEHWGNNKIKKIDPSGMVTDWAGNGMGYKDGPGTKAKFRHPYHISVDKATGNIYIADYGNNRIRKIANDSLHMVCTVAGTGVSGYKDDSWFGDCCDENKGGNAQFNSPIGITYVESFLLYIGDSYNNRIRQIDP